jgi:hypothetical protein
MLSLRARPRGLVLLLLAVLPAACGPGDDATGDRAGPAPEPAAGGPQEASPPADARAAGPPAAAIEWPAEGSAHRTVRLDARGSARGVDEVYVNGRATPVAADGRWTADVELSAGLAEIAVHAPPGDRDAGEPPLLALRRLVVDLEAPLIALDEAPGAALDTPPGARLVGATSVELVGRVEDGAPGRPASLTLDDQPLELRDVGSFRVTAQLAVEGEQTLRLVAEDAAGNRARLALLVVRDTTPPTIDVTLPTDAELERRSDDLVRVRGRVRDEHPGGLTADGEPVELAPDGSFELEVELASGGRTLALVAEDAAGNRSQPVAVDLAPDRDR